MEHGMPKITIGGIDFELRMSDGEIYHAGRQALARCLNLDTQNTEAVLETLHEICGLIDYALGDGAVKRIVGDKPVSLPMALKIVNTIIRTCGDRYAEYIRREYTGGNQGAKIQPVKP